MSIASQESRDFEGIVIDGGSTDGTVQFLEEKESLDCLVSEPDNGIYDAMNKGIDFARGEYCLFLNAGDTLYAPILLKELKKNLDADVVVGRIQVLCIDNPAKNGIRDFALQDIRKKYLFSKTLPHQSTLIRRKLFTIHGKYDTNFAIAGDHDFFVRILNRGVSMCFAPLCVSVFYLDGVSSTMKYSQLYEDEIEQLRKNNFSLLYRGWRRSVDTMYKLIS
jgi:glycosyltransferase involved in cell wall biosynthesis